MRDKDDIKQSLSADDVEKILSYLNIDYKYNQQGDIQMETACHNAHNGSHKLYYYPDTQTFHCFTECAESFDIYSFVMRVHHTRHIAMNFNEAFKTVADILGINLYQPQKRVVQFGGSKNNLINDWDFIEKLSPRRSKEPEFKAIDKSILNMFPNWYTKAWIEEGIKPSTHEKFNIRFNPDMNQTIIPHKDIRGKLIGIRVRNWRSVDKGKYLPLYYKDKGYQHPLGYNLYGLYENKETIKRKRKVMIVESEKSSMLSHSMFGSNNFCVSLCGSTMNQYQADLLLGLGVDEVIIALDKDYLNQPDSAYFHKVKKIAQLFINKASVYHITDTRNVLEYQDCVLDADKETVINVMKHDKYKVDFIEELE